MSISIQSNYNSKKKLSFFESHNILHDKWMKTLTGNQWKMSCFLHRKTRGWQKFQDKISHSQCVEATGLSKNTCIKVINELIEMGKVGKFKTGGIGQEECYYYLIFEEETINSNISYGLHNCTGTPLITEHTIEENKQRKEKIYKKEKEISEKMFVHGCISLPHSVYEEILKTHTKAHIDRILEEMDTYYTCHPDRAKKHGQYASTLRFWIQNDIKKRQRKKEAEELAYRQKEEEDRQFQIQQEAIRAEKQRQEAIKTKALQQKIQEKIPLVKQFEEKFPGIVKLCHIWQNGVCEVKDRLHKIHHLFMQCDDFEDQLTQKLREIGCLC